MPCHCEGGFFLTGIHLVVVGLSLISRTPIKLLQSLPSCLSVSSWGKGGLGASSSAILLMLFFPDLSFKLLLQVFIRSNTIDWPSFLYWSQRPCYQSAHLKNSQFNFINYFSKLLLITGNSGIVPPTVNAATVSLQSLDAPSSTIIAKLQRAAIAVVRRLHAVLSPTYFSIP